MDDIQQVLSQLLDDKGQPQRGYTHRTNIFTAVLRRLWHGWFGSLLLLVMCLLMAWIIHFPLSSIHHTITKMDVMLIKERDGNRNNNISYEIVGQITGWHTTTNKYDEMAIMISKPVVERMLRTRHVVDSAIMDKVMDLGHILSEEDSIELVRSLTEQYADKISVSYDEPINGQKNSIVTLSMEGDAAASQAMLSGLVDSYNAYTRDYNNKCYQRTIDFLTQCIDSIKNELDKIDAFDEGFSERNFIIDVKQQTDTYLNVDKDDETDVRNMQLQRQLLSIIRKYMTDMGENYVVVPANTGIEDPQINRIVIQFNELVMRRSNYMTSMGEDAMRVKTITNQIEDQRQAIIISIDKLTQAFDIRMAKYEKNKKESEDRLVKMPHKRIVKDKINRERDIIIPLYTLLQRKRIETIIARSAEQDLARVITPPYSIVESLMKSSKVVYLFGILLGLILSSIYLLCIQIPHEKIDLSDVLKDCILPIWGVLPAEDKGQLYSTALEAIVTRIHMSGAKKLLVTSGYDDEITPNFVTNLQHSIDRRGIEGLGVTCEGNYHANPLLPELSNQADTTIYLVRAGYSRMRSIDFIGYAVKEGLLKNGAVIVTDASTNETLPINFGAFDYEVPKGFNAVKSRAKK